MKKTKQTEQEQLKNIYNEMTPHFDTSGMLEDWKKANKLCYDSWYPILVEEERKRKEERERKCKRKKKS